MQVLYVAKWSYWGQTEDRAQNSFHCGDWNDLPT